MSSGRLQDVWENVKLLRWRRVEDVFKTCLEHVFKTSSRRTNVCWEILYTLYWNTKFTILKKKCLFTVSIKISLCKNVKQLISALQNVISRQRKDLWKFKKFSGLLFPAVRSRAVAETMWKERKLSFHPHSVCEMFTSLEICCK